MSPQKKRTLKLISFSLFSLLLFYQINTIAYYSIEYLDLGYSEFSIHFLTINIIGLFSISLLAFLLSLKEIDYRKLFLGKQAKKGMWFLGAQSLLIGIFSINFTGQAFPNGQEIKIIFLFLGLCIGFELFLRVFLYQWAKNWHRHIRPLFLGAFLCLLVASMIIPYKESHFLEFYSSNKIIYGMIVLALFASWCLDRIHKITHSFPFVVSGGLVFYFIFFNPLFQIITHLPPPLYVIVSGALTFIIFLTYIPRTEGKEYAVPISELTYVKTIRRRVRGSDGLDYFVDKAFRFPYDPGTKNTKKRVAAKMMDLFLYFFVAAFVFLAFGASSDDGYDIAALGFLLMMLLNPITEHFLGNTFGKYFFNLKVIDDYANYPKLSTSYKRNLYTIVASLPFLRVVPGGVSQKIADLDRHNHLTSTYVVRHAEIPDIIEMLEKGEKEPVMETEVGASQPETGN